MSYPDISDIYDTLPQAGAELMITSSPLDPRERDHLEVLFEDIMDELWSQDQRGFGVENDDRNSPIEWRDHLVRQVDKLDIAIGCADAPLPAYRDRLIQVAALAVSAVQAWDRAQAKKAAPRRKTARMHILAVDLIRRDR